MKFDNSEVTIRDVQKVQLELLNEFDRICKKHNIKYQLFAGTLLGAIRHDGFIPWDDDIDVCMLREEYEKLLEVWTNEKTDKYFLQNYKTDKSSMFHFSKFIKNNTILRTQMYRDVEMNQGIFIDIFPMDNVKPNSITGKIHSFLYKNAFLLISTMNKNRAYIARNAIVKYTRLSLYYITKLMPKEKIHQIVDKIICIFDNQETDYVACITNGDKEDIIKKFTVKRNTFFNLTEWNFEGMQFPIPRDYDYVLTKNYGDYMKLPPIEERIPHHGIIEVNLDTNQKND